ncbi:hypothetical protein [Raoultella ornithinolytica]|uniref:hypothetical protein n=1 Tax=Raoultella ornithinolytica TaxID=54291 RepID=UPI001F3E41B2|nr:hypothetical protein [Raoultella ornithinolytica]
MTDITELAQREKFEAWWERTQHNGNPPRFGWAHWRDGEGYKVDDDESELDGMWEAWKAASAELVEALESQGAEIEWMRNRIEGLARELEVSEERRVKWFKKALGEKLDGAEQRNAELVEALEKAQAQSSKWLEAYHKAVSIGARYEERIAELESKLANPVQLPKTNGYWTETEKAYEEAITLAKRQIRLAGFRCEGGE